MSTDIYIQVIRKSDGQPSERVYLGGNGLRQEIMLDYKLEATVQGCYAYNLGDLANIRKFIAKHYNTISDYAGCTDVDDWYQGDYYHYWLVVEE